MLQLISTRAAAPRAPGPADTRRFEYRKITDLPSDLLQEKIVPRLLELASTAPLNAFSQTSRKLRREAIAACHYVIRCQNSWKESKALAAVDRIDAGPPAPFSQPVATKAQQFCDYAAGLAALPAPTISVDFTPVAFAALWKENKESDLPELFPSGSSTQSLQQVTSKISRHLGWHQDNAEPELFMRQHFGMIVGSFLPAPRFRQRMIEAVYQKVEEEFDSSR